MLSKSSQHARIAQLALVTETIDKKINYFFSYAL